MKYVILSLILIALSNKAFSQTEDSDKEVGVYLGGWSYHLGTDYDYNGDHNMVVFEYGDVVFGGFKNSFNENTYVLGYHWYKDVEDFRFSAMGLLTYGYSQGNYYEMFYERGSGAKALVVPVVSVSYTKYQVQPAIGLMGNALAVLVKAKF